MKSEQINFGHAKKDKFMILIRLRATEQGNLLRTVRFRLTVLIKLLSSRAHTMSVPMKYARC